MKTFILIFETSKINNTETVKKDFALGETEIIRHRYTIKVSGQRALSILGEIY